MADLFRAAPLRSRWRARARCWRSRPRVTRIWRARPRPNARGIPVLTLHRDLFRNHAAARGSVTLRRDPARSAARVRANRWRRSQPARPRAWPMSVATRQAGRAMRGRWSRQASASKSLRPVGQFRWSTHVELTSYHPVGHAAFPGKAGAQPGAPRRLNRRGPFLGNEQYAYPARPSARQRSAAVRSPSASRKWTGPVKASRPARMSSRARKERF